MLLFLDTIPYITIFIFGITIGSFLNVCIYRLPLRESVVTAPSHCMTCGRKLRWYDMVPVFSWLVLGGKCRNCKSKISVQYPIIEGVNGILYVVIFAVNGLVCSSLIYCLMASALLVLSVIDWRTYEIPFGINVFLFVLGIAMAVLDRGNLAEHLIGMVCVSGVILMVTGLLFARPILILFGASKSALVYAYPYMMIYLLGTLPSMIAVGMNPFINAQGYSVVGMLSVAIGAVANLILDPLFIFVLGFGVRGAAIATILSQTLSAAFVLFFLTGKAELKVRFLRKNEISECTGYAKNIVSLGMAGFIMQLTNSLVTICCNNVLSVTGGDIYISVMTIISSVRQLVETPIHAINEGTSPILSYNYGARRPARVRKSIAVLAVMILIYTGVMWGSIIMIPEVLIRIFSSDKTLMKDAVPALKQYFAAFIFMDLQYMGQTVFKSLNKKKQAIFFSLLRKVFIVVPLTYLMPYVLHMGTDGVFLAEPVSNVIGGSICFITMLCTVMPELKRMEA